VLYYRSLGTAPTLLRMSNISGKPYMRVMTYKALVLYIKIPRRLLLVIHTFLQTKTLLYGVLTETTHPFEYLLKLHVYLRLNRLISYQL
jgi:hypothetical protein